MVGCCRLHLSAQTLTKLSAKQRRDRVTGRHFWADFGMCQSPKVSHDVWQTSNIVTYIWSLKCCRMPLLGKSRWRGAAQVLGVLLAGAAGKGMLLYVCTQYSPISTDIGKFALNTSWPFIVRLLGYPVMHDVHHCSLLQEREAGKSFASYLACH